MMLQSGNGPGENNKSGLQILTKFNEQITKLMHNNTNNANSMFKENSWIEVGHVENKKVFLVQLSLIGQRYKQDHST